jgi:hypothetical protein
MQHFGESLNRYWAAWDLFPEPKQRWAAATWIPAVIGDANFRAIDYNCGSADVSADTREAMAVMDFILGGLMFWKALAAFIALPGVFAFGVPLLWALHSGWGARFPVMGATSILVGTMLLLACMREWLPVAWGLHDCGRVRLPLAHHSRRGAAGST